MPFIIYLTSKLSQSFPNRKAEISPPLLTLFLTPPGVYSPIERGIHPDPPTEPRILIQTPLLRISTQASRPARVLIVY